MHLGKGPTFIIFRDSVTKPYQIRPQQLPSLPKLLKLFIKFLYQRWVFSNKLRPPPKILLRIFFKFFPKLLQILRKLALFVILACPESSALIAFCTLDTLYRQLRPRCKHFGILLHVLHKLLKLYLLRFINKLFVWLKLSVEFSNKYVAILVFAPIPILGKIYKSPNVPKLPLTDSHLVF